MYSKANTRIARFHRGAIMSEALVSAAILLAGIGVVAKTQYNLRRLWSDTRHFQLATDELRNQLERLIQLPPSQLADALGSLKVSPEIATVLPECRIEGNRIDDSLGSRIQLRIDWQRVGTGKPLELTGWLRFGSQPADETTQPDQNPLTSAAVSSAELNPSSEESPL